MENDMYTIGELSEISGLSKSVLQRYRKLGILVDKEDIRLIPNPLTKGYTKKKVWVYSDEELDKITKNNFVSGYTIPKNINARKIASRLKYDSQKQKDVEKLSYWLDIESDVSEAVRKYDIVNSYKHIFCESDNVLYSKKSRILEIQDLLFLHGSIEHIPDFPDTNSLWSKELWQFYGFTSSESQKMVSDLQKNNLNKLLKKKKENPAKYKGYNQTSIDYWIKKGYTTEEAIEKRKDFQTTFSKKKCIEKYGEKEGIKRWQHRQDKWQQSIKNKSIEERDRINRAKMFKRSYSKISQELFVSLYYAIKEDFDDIRFATMKNGIINDDGNNNEYCVYIENSNSFRYLDFYIPSIKKCIEFNGDYWHNLKGNKKRDFIREQEIKKAIDKINILYIIESEYRDNPDKVIKRCLEFIYE